MLDGLRDVHWAWRNVRARGLRGVLSVVLLALALAANAVVFAASDSLVFRPLPYDDPDRLIEIQRMSRPGGRPSPFLTPLLLDAWRAHEDLFVGVHGYLTKTVFLTGDGAPELVRTADVTPGLIELLGARPRWGRTLVDGDERPASPQVVLISEALARARFGDPASAVGRTLETTADPLQVVGVMPRSFRFPQNAYQVWRALDPRGPLARGFVGSSSLARLRPALPLATAAAAVEQRGASVAAAAGAPASARFTAAAWGGGPGAPGARRQMLLVLVGAAACLLLIVCANVASLELATALQRARTYAIQLSLGASRAELCRITLIEAATLAGAATAVAAMLASIGGDAIATLIPERIVAGNVNPIDLDGRAVAFMIALAAATWLLVAMPLVIYVSRGSLLGLLKLEGHPASASITSGRIRQALTVGQVAVAVLLIIGGVLYVRTYLALLDLDKGFDSAGVVAIELTVPPQALPSAAERRALLDRVRAQAGVIAATEASAPSASGERHSVAGIDTGDALPQDDNVILKVTRVDSGYFSTLRIPLRAGRRFDSAEPATSAIVSETFARRYWPQADAIGKRFRWDPRGPWLQIVGVVGHVRDRADGMAGPSSDVYSVYLAQQPPRPPAPNAGPPAATGGFFGLISLLVRVESTDRISDVIQVIRAAEPRFALEAELVDDLYARYFEDRLLAARLVGAFGIFAFVVAMAGVYAVMTFLVAARTREIGIRMALGAHGPAVQRFVMASAIRMAALGALLGVGAALGASRWIESQLFGVHPADPVMMTTILVTTVATAALAAWQPARRATRVNPLVALRAQ